MQDKRFKKFFFFLFFTTLFPYLSYIFPFLPRQLLGFNWAGWAWIIMLSVTIIHFTKSQRVTFPIWSCLPWILYISGYLVYDFSIMGLQLTLQYLLPILIGIVASDFVYTEEKLRWLFTWLIRLSVTTYVLFVFGTLFRGGYTADSAMSPMFLSVAASLMMGFYFVTKRMKFLLYFGILFLSPFISVTRMGIAAFITIFVFHFANKKVINKVLYGFLGILIVLLVFNSKGFQEKTFFEGRGSINELTLDYYHSSTVNSSGRSTLVDLLQPGLRKAPLFGNGPRSDYNTLIVTGLQEVHNDYLSVRYNYGYVGLVLLIFGIIVNFFIILHKIKRLKSPFPLVLGTSLLTLFLSLGLFMYSDNILKYTIYFPNYFFAMIGIFSSICKKGYMRPKRQKPLLEAVTKDNVQRMNPN